MTIPEDFQIDKCWIESKAGCGSQVICKLKATNYKFNTSTPREI